MALEVSTVSRRTEPWWTAAGAIDTVTDEEMRRSGVQTLPEALRLATGVHVGQPNARGWAVAVRGFNVLSSNKINVQLDGRNLFTPFFSGVYWDAQDTVIEDIDRIEVFRGPAGALWGPYAVNGFIQIRTKPAWETQGLLTSVGVGTETRFGTVRFGGQLSPSTFYRTYAKYSVFKSSRNRAGARSRPPTDLVQGGFRTDTRARNDTTVTFHGDIYTNQGTPHSNEPWDRFWGANLAGRWRRTLSADSELQFSGYYDHSDRRYAGPFNEWRDTVSASGRYRWRRDAHDLQVGTDVLISRDDIVGTAVNIISPSKRTYSLASLFAHDTITLIPQRLRATIGTEVEHSGFSGWEVQPTARLAWTPSTDLSTWAAVSRAVRTPVRLDEDLVSRGPTGLVFEGNDALKPEKAVSFEAGVRRRFGERLAVDVAGFSTHYNDVRSYESRTPPSPASLPWTFKNSTNAHATGVETTVLFEPSSGLFVKASYRYLDLDLSNDPGSGEFLQSRFEANDPRHVLAVSARINLPRRFEVDATLRHASRLRLPVMEGYTTADVRIGWVSAEHWQFDLIGQNLLDPQHPEFVTPNALNEELARSVTAKVTYRY